MIWLGDVIRAIDVLGPTLGDLGDACADAAGFDPPKLYRAAWELIEVGLPALAVLILQRVRKDLPGVPAVIHELVAAYENDGRHAEAVGALLEEPALLQRFMR